MTRIIPALLALILGLSGGVAFAKVSAKGTFLSVSGTVEIKSQTNHKGRLAKVGDTVVEGQRVVTDKDSNAVLQFFDGSQLTIKPGTDFWLSELKKPADKDKILKFKMLFGQLIAQVTKLSSSNSAFEIQAGGVVCGVRGTHFSMDFNPSNNKVVLDVFDGTVYSHFHGHSQDFGPGSEGQFLNGKLLGGLKPPGPGQNPALTDLNNQFQNNVNVNHDNGQNDPAVGGTSAVHITVDAQQRENQP
jgi:FecR protein